MQNYLVVRREYDDDDNVVETHPETRVTSVPAGTTLKQIKDVLSQSGHSYQWGLYTVLPEKDWYPIEEMKHPDEYGERAKRLLFYEAGMDNISYEISYEELLDKLNDEKRITLRLPVGLHFTLSRAAGDMTLNAYCTKTLADAVGYSDLPEFEAQRRKPGRPKKVQDGE